MTSEFIRCDSCGRGDGAHDKGCVYAGITARFEKETKGPRALDVQVAGTHYKGKAIQPVEYIHANNLGFLEGCIVKRITRWRDKPAADRFEDLLKIKHEVDLLIELETKKVPPV